MARTILNSIILILCLLGITVASLALREHYNTGASPCSINEVWDCGTVNHSDYALLAGVPVATIGIVGYALLAILIWRFPRIAAAAALVGLVFSLRLTWVEWKKLLVWCLYCVSSQIIIAIVFLLTVIVVWLSAKDRKNRPNNSGLVIN